MKLKVGQQFEVVEVLTDGGYPSGAFNIGGHTLHFKEYSNGDGQTLCNGPYRFIIPFAHMFASELKRVGRLTVTKIK